MASMYATLISQITLSRYLANKIDAIKAPLIDAILKPKCFEDEGWSEPFAHNEHHADTINVTHTVLENVKQTPKN